MRYALLLYADEGEDPGDGGAESAARARAHAALAAELARGGQPCASHALGPAASATTVRRRGGRTLLSDGPCAQTPQPLLGLLLIEARDLDEAIAIAERAPDAGLGAVEIRPLREAR